MKGDSGRNFSERKIPKIPVYADELHYFGLSEPVRGDIIPELVPILDFITKELSRIVPNYGERVLFNGERVLFTNYGVFAGIVETCLRLQFCLGVDREDKRHNPRLIKILIDNLKRELNGLRIMMKGEKYYFDQSADRGNNAMTRFSEARAWRNQRIPEGAELTANGRDFLPEVLPILNFIKKELSKIIPNYEERVRTTNYGILSDIIETCLRLQIYFGIEDKRHSDTYLDILIHNLNVEMNEIYLIIRDQRGK